MNPNICPNHETIAEEQAIRIKFNLSADEIRAACNVSECYVPVKLGMYEDTRVPYVIFDRKDYANCCDGEYRKFVSGSETGLAD